MSEKIYTILLFVQDGGLTLDKRKLNISVAVNREKAKELAKPKDKEKLDKRNLHLVREGCECVIQYSRHHKLHIHSFRLKSSISFFSSFHNRSSVVHAECHFSGKQQQSGEVTRMLNVVCQFDVWF